MSYGGLNKSPGNAFWFELTGAPVRMASHYFFIDDATTTTTATASSTSTAPAAPGTTTSLSASGTSSAAASTAPETSTGMGPGTIAGIAVGASLGGLVVVALAVWWLVRGRKRRHALGAIEKSASGATSPTGPAVVDAASHSYSPLGQEYYEHGNKRQQYEPVEMPSSRPLAEMSSARPPAELSSN